MPADPIAPLGAPTFESYQRDASRTLNAALTATEQTLDAASGMAEEAGEVLALVRKHFFQHRPLDRERLAIELGDALWCLTAVATLSGLSLGEIASRNLSKLADRYPDGLGHKPAGERGTP
ncbi:MAG: nucleoside triphosphate pyrophosphohydrolase family protein [Gemmatimonadaceae bacterium]